jgi:hypothetical protein
MGDVLTYAVFTEVYPSEANIERDRELLRLALKRS